MVHIKSRSRPGNVREHQGFTTIELMVVVAILGILAALAAPSFTTLVQNWRIRQISDDVAFSFAFARSEAIRRGGGVVVRRITPNAADCPGLDDSDSTEWGCGWIIFADSNGNGRLDSNEQLLRTSHAARRLQVQRSTPATFFRMDQWGEANGIGALGFIARPLSGEPGTPTAICINTGGRIDIRKGATACLS